MPLVSADFFIPLPVPLIIMVQRIARQLFRNVVGVPELRKALAFAIYVKNHKQASVIKDWTYRELSRLTNLSPTTCKKRIDDLISLRIVTKWEYRGHRYMRFGKLSQGIVHTKKRIWQPQTADIRIQEYDSIKETEKALMALVIVEDTNRKDHIRQLIKLAYDPAPFTSEKKVKRAKIKCNKCGYGKVFVDGGLSYRRITKWLHCGPNKVKEIIGFGESTEMFVAHRRPWVLVEYIGNYSAKDALTFYSFDKPVFATRNNFWYKPSLRFKLTI